MSQDFKITNQSIASQFLASHSEESGRRLVYVNSVDVFAEYLPKEGYYKVFNSRGTFDRKILDFVDIICNGKKSVTQSLIKDIKEMIKLLCEKTHDNLSTDYLALSDGLLNTRTFQVEPFDIEKITFFNLSLSSSELSNKATCPQFLKFLDQVVVDDNMEPDKELQLGIQERFGYCLLPTNKCEKAFFFVGGGANGKSVILNILRKMIGEEFCTSKSIETLTTDKFSASGLIGKRLNICMEEESKYMKSDKFKALISGEPIDMEKKYSDSFCAPINVKFVFATNNIPTFDGIGHSILRRLDIIPFNRTFSLEEQDKDILKKLLFELPGITLWALEGAKRLVSQNFKFTEVDTLNIRKTELRNSISSAAMFISEAYKEMPGATERCDAIYEEYKQWCTAKGKKSVNYFSFFNDVTEVYPESVSKQTRWSSDDKKNVRVRQLVKRADYDLLIPEEDHSLPNF